MISLGKQIRSSMDGLQNVSIADFVQMVKSPDDILRNQIEQLRIINEVDKESYSRLKRQLPYIVCAHFNPSFRKTENFIYTEYFIIDIDHISSKGLYISELRSAIQIDRRVVACFLSPSEDGLKIMFRLSERCTDSGLYSIFYKAFARQFAMTYHLEQVVDNKTSDVCRACFMSCDENVFYNENAEAVNINEFINEDNSLFMRELMRSQKQEQTDVSVMERKGNVDPAEDELDKIKQILKLKRSRAVEQKSMFVSQEVEKALAAGLSTALYDAGLEIVETTNINYGIKLKLSSGSKQAEINIFHGKKGFSVVEIPKSGTDLELNSLSAELISLWLEYDYVS